MAYVQRPSVDFILALRRWGWVSPAQIMRPFCANSGEKSFVANDFCCHNTIVTKRCLNTISQKVSCCGLSKTKHKTNTLFFFSCHKEKSIKPETAEKSANKCCRKFASFQCAVYMNVETTGLKTSSKWSPVKQFGRQLCTVKLSIGRSSIAPMNSAPL